MKQILCIAVFAFLPQAVALAQAGKPVFEVQSFKVGSDYYPLLDAKSPVITADSGDFPRTESEKVYRQQSGRRGGYARNEDIRARGQLRSRIQVIGDATWVRLTIRNAGEKPMRMIHWDFAFPRFEDGKLALRFDVASKAEIKPGEKKTLKQQLPPGANKCKVIHVDAAEEARNGPPGNFESVCGKGIHDATQLKQETVIIKRIEFADGSVWQRPE
ncbi:MAG: hypothetical protein ACKVX9_14485 [Blastocatellia bacterium]